MQTDRVAAAASNDYGSLSFLSADFDAAAALADGNVT